MSILIDQSICERPEESFRSVTSLKMRLLISCLAIALALCASSFGYRLGNYVGVHELNTNTLSSLEQLPPEDPAIHSLPTEPTVPLVPVCAKQGYFRDPFNCRKFYYCRHPNDVPAGFYCQSTLIFNTVTNTCDNPDYVQC